MKQVLNGENYPVSIYVQEFDMGWNITENQSIWKKEMNQIGI